MRRMMIRLARWLLLRAGANRITTVCATHELTYTQIIDTRRTGLEIFIKRELARALAERLMATADNIEFRYADDERKNTRTYEARLYIVAPEDVLGIARDSL